MNTTLAMRLWLYISKPFQITKVLEILYALDWVWFALLSLLPSRFVSGSMFTRLRDIMPDPLISMIFIVIASIHVIALWNNIVWLRKFNLLFNVAILTYFTSRSLLNLPISSGLGYFVILIGITMFAFWRMDETH